MQRKQECKIERILLPSTASLRVILLSDLIKLMPSYITASSYSDALSD